MPPQDPFASIAQPLSSQPTASSSDPFASIAQPIPFVLKNPAAPLITPISQPQADIKR